MRGNEEPLTRPRYARAPSPAWRAREDEPSLPPEHRLAFLNEGALRFLRILRVRERDRDGLLEAIAITRRHLLDRVERAFDLAHRDRAFRRDLARHLRGLIHQLFARHAGGDHAQAIKLC